LSAAVGPGLTLGKCGSCHARYVPVDGPCPRCGSTDTGPYVSEGLGRVLASTSLEVPPPGFDRPHLLALVEVEDGVRLLVVPEAPLPVAGQTVRVRLEGAVYRAGPASPSVGERGEGDAPGAGRSRPPFEPPR